MSDDSDTKAERRGSAPKPPEQPKPPDAPAVPAVEKRMSPREHALETGNGPKPTQNTWTGRGMSTVRGSVEHEVAKQLHGWDDHEHETAEPIQLTRAEYLAALKATHPEDEVEKDEKGQPKLDRHGNVIVKKPAGNPVPHPAALSPYKGKRGALRIGETPKQEQA